MLKVATIIGTRPELIKLSRIIAELDRQFEHVLIHSGQNYDYELNEVFFNDLEINKPKHFLNVADESSSETIGNVIINSHKILKRIKPDAFLIYGDTNTCLSAIAAKRLNIPVFHMEAGNRCFDERVPEEINRRIIDHISDINMPLTEHARRYLLNEGIRAETIIKTGSTMIEVLNYYSEKINAANILEKLNLQNKKYILVSAHREENVDVPDRLKNLVNSLKDISNNFSVPIIFSTHPRTKDRFNAFNIQIQDTNIKFLDALGFLEYIKLQKNALCVLSDSGTITEEASILRIPAITIRQTHERPEGMDHGVLIMSDINSERLISAIEMIASQDAKLDPKFGSVDDYFEDNVSTKVARIIQSYTDYVNRTVWQKHQ